MTETLENIPEDMYGKTFENLIEKMKLCIKYHGDYFEYLM